MFCNQINFVKFFILRFPPHSAKFSNSNQIAQKTLGRKMVVNGELLQKQMQAFKLGKDTGADYYKELFSKQPDVADAYGGVDPDTVGRSQRYIMLAINELQALMGLPNHVNDERNWRSSLSNVKEHYSDADVNLSHFGKTKDAWLATVQKHAGGLSAEQKKNWEELFKKACDDMKKWGWY